MAVFCLLPRQFPRNNHKQFHISLGMTTLPVYVVDSSPTTASIGLAPLCIYNTLFFLDSCSCNTLLYQAFVSPSYFTVGAVGSFVTIAPYQGCPICQGSILPVPLQQGQVIFCGSGRSFNLAPQKEQYFSSFDALQIKCPHFSHLSLYNIVFSFWFVGTIPQTNSQSVGLSPA